MVLIKTKIEAGYRAIQCTSVKLYTHQAMTCVCTVILGGPIREARNLSSTAGQMIISTFQINSQYPSVSCEELYGCNIPPFFSKPFSRFSHLFCFLSSSALRGLSEFMTHHMLLEIVSGLLSFCMALGGLLLFLGSKGVVRGFAAFYSCLQMLLLGLCLSLISQIIFKIFFIFFPWAISPLLPSAFFQPSSEPIHLLLHPKSWLRGTAHLPASHRIPGSRRSCLPATPMCSKQPWCLLPTGVC